MVMQSHLPLHGWQLSSWSHKVRDSDGRPLWEAHRLERSIGHDITWYQKHRTTCDCRMQGTPLASLSELCRHDSDCLVENDLNWRKKYKFGDGAALL